MLKIADRGKASCATCSVERLVTRQGTARVARVPGAALNVIEAASARIANAALAGRFSDAGAYILAGSNAAGPQFHPVLFGAPSAPRRQIRLYVGESAELKKRLQRQGAEPAKAWAERIFIVTSDQVTLTKVDAEALQFLLHAVVAQANGVVLDHVLRPKQPQLSPEAWEWIDGEC